jgi:FAD/FMN-containing dehydrogenase
MDPASALPLTRRQVLQGTVLAGLAAVPDPGRFVASAAGADAGCAPPAGFPTQVELYQVTYENWAGTIHAEPIWACAPRTADEVAEVVTWAAGTGYRVRPRGYAHGWSPLTITAGTTCDTRIVLLDTTRYLTAVDVAGAGAVRAQCGASLDTVLEFLQARGYGLTATPAPGSLTVGGALAIDAHGTGVPAAGEHPVPGDAYGSLSNRVLSLTAVVWDAPAGRYGTRTFTRADPECAALLAHLGRALVTDVTLSVREDYHLRCLSEVGIPAGELFAADPDAGTRTFAGFVEESGRVEAIWFPFTAEPWLKVWSLSPQRPPTSRATTTPYNYPFSDNVPEPIAELAGAIESGQSYLAPAFGAAQYEATVAGLVATNSADLWGRSADLLRYVRPTTLRMHANGYAVLARRADIQRVVAEFAAFFAERLYAYAADSRYPVNGPVEIRVTGLDDAVGSADPPALSAVRVRADRPDWDVAIWIDVLTLPNTPDAGVFFREIEQFMFDTYTGGYAMARPEWSKGWAYTADGAWTHAGFITDTVPALFRAGTPDTWDPAVAALHTADPHRVLSNAFLDTLLPATPPTAQR